MPLNRDFFFYQVGLHLFGGALKPSQRSGLSAMLDEWDRNHASKDDRWLAYMLATTHHETDRQMRPINEYGSDERFRRLYDITGERPILAKKMENTTPGDGVKYHGRGFVQLTWKLNYRTAGQKLGLGTRLVDNPDLALDPAIATRILFAGMIDGWFTGRKLGDHFAGTRGDWVNARRIINGLDKAQLIADYGNRYYAALSYTT